MSDPAAKLRLAEQRPLPPKAQTPRETGGSVVWHEGCRGAEILARGSVNASTEHLSALAAAKILLIADLPEQGGVAPAPPVQRHALSRTHPRGELTGRAAGGQQSCDVVGGHGGLPAANNKSRAHSPSRH